MILANGCNITKSEKFKGVWILSVPTVHYQLPFTLNAIKNYNHSHTKTTCLHATVISTVSVRMAVMSLPAPLAIKVLARNRQDVRLTGWSPIRAGHARNQSDSDHWPINRCISIRYYVYMYRTGEYERGNKRLMLPFDLPCGVHILNQ